MFQLGHSGDCGAVVVIHVEEALEPDLGPAEEELTA